jgi:hypothetical protein
VLRAVAFKKRNMNRSYHLERPGSFSLGREKITRPHLVIAKMKISFFESLDFFASFFGQAKNEEPSRLEAKSNLIINFSLSNACCFCDQNVLTGKQFFKIMI